MEAGDLDAAVHEDIAEDEGLALGDTATVEFPIGEPVQLNIVATYSSNIVTATSWIINLPTWEEYFISVFGGILGTALGIIFGVTIVGILPSSFISTLAIPWRTLVIYLIIAAGAGILSSFFPARRASRLNVLEAIANE